MAAQDELITFSLLGQEFRVRAPRSDRDRVARVAADIEARVREHKQHGAASDLRAVVMAAYEIAFEFDEVSSDQREHRKAEKALRTTDQAMDQLIARLDKEITSPDGDKE